MSITDLRPTALRLTDRTDLCEALGLVFSEQQLDAITAPLEPGVIIAGAGSGKTTVMAARVVWLVGTGAVRPDEILGLTFTRKAASELSARVRVALQRAGVLSDEGVDDAGEQVIMTYDAFAARLVADHGLRLGIEGDPMMITGAARFRLAARVVSAAAGPFEYIARLRPRSITERVLKLDGDLAAHLVDPSVLDQQKRVFTKALDVAPRSSRGEYASVKAARVAAEERLELASLVADYRALKRAHGLVEFADQMSMAATLATAVPAVSALLRRQFRVVLLDEYQDTSSAQAQMLRGLFSGSSVDEGRGHAVTAVGDPSQAIYGWRGAAASNIMAFARDFPRADGNPAHRFALTVNRRSGQSILDVANDLAATLRSDAGGSLGQTNVLVAPPGTPRGHVRAATFATWPEEVRWVVEQIVAAHTVGTVSAWSEVAVLLRRNADIAPLFAELTALDVPAEIVGLGGLLELPEIVDIVATLQVVDDVTANPALVRLLSGARWAIGPADLALLGRRAVALARVRDVESEPSDALLAALEQAVADVDPTEVVSLSDALDDPGDLPYSGAARQRFAQLSAELTVLREHADEPVLDLVRHVIAHLGLDVELRATPVFAHQQRVAQLAAFLDAISAYVDVDGDASLSGLLGYLKAELEQGAGLEQAVPTATNSVKLLTVHKAKGLEWTMVFLPALADGVFPSDRVTDNWVKNAGVLPASLRGDAESYPQLAEVSHRGFDAYAEALKAEQGKAEDRLAYVGVTRARQVLVATAHTWVAGAAKPRTSSRYFERISAEAARQGAVRPEAPPAGVVNPLTVQAPEVAWPTPLDATSWARRHEAATAVRALRGRDAVPDEPATLDVAERIAGWDDDLARLLDEARHIRHPVAAVPMPTALSASALLVAHRDPAVYAAELLRPMPRPPRPNAQLGTRFHAWVEQRASTLSAPTQGFLIDPFDEADDEDLADSDFEALCRAFERGPYAKTAPVAVEAPFSMLLGGEVVRGRIDAVYAGPEGFDFQVVDWKTSWTGFADPLQLSLYRLAWAELRGVPPQRVDAVFYAVRSGHISRPQGLLGRAALEELTAKLTG